METRVCGWERCSNPVVVGGHGRPRLYCSRSCRQRAYELARAEEIIRKRAGQSAAPVSGSDESPAAADGSPAGANGSSGVGLFGSDESPEPLPPLPAPMLERLAQERERSPFAELSTERRQLIEEVGWTARDFDRWYREAAAKHPEVDPLETFFMPGT